MGARPSLTAVADAPRAGVAAAEERIAEALRRLDASRERVEAATGERIDEIRGEAEGLARLARKRARRIRKRARKRMRALRTGWRVGSLAGGMAGGALIVALARRPLSASGLIVMRRAAGGAKRLAGGGRKR
jgi:hypothetical protein